MSKVFSTIQSYLPNGEGSERNRVPVPSVEVNVNPDDNKSNAFVSVCSLNGNEEGSISMANLDLDQWTDNLLLETKAATDKLIAEGQKENLQNFQITHENQATIMENQKDASDSQALLHDKMDYLVTHATPNGKNYLNRLKKESEKKMRASQKKSTVPSSKPVVRGMDKHVKQRSQSTKEQAEAKKRDGRVLA